MAGGRHSLGSTSKSGAIWLLHRSWMFVLFLAWWEINFRVNESLFIPPFSEVLSLMLSKWFSTNPGAFFTSDLFHKHALASLYRLAWGLGIAIVVGVTAGLLLGSYRNLEASAKWIIRFGLSTPATVLLPLALVLFGITDPMYIFLIAVGSVWPILLNTLDGVRGVDTEVRASARSLRLRGWRMFRTVTLPAASPQVFAGIRVSLGIALILVVISEIFVATKGIGFDIILSQRTFSFDEMWASIAFMALLAIALNALFNLVERRVLGWHRARREVNA